MEEDYLMRMIQGFAGMAYWILSGGNRPPHAQELQSEAVTEGKLRSFTPRILALLTIPMILGLLTVEGPVRPQVLHAAVLLGDVAEEQWDDPDLRERLHERAVCLYDHGSAEDPQALIPHRATATRSAEAIDRRPLPVPSRLSLVRVWHRLGHYDRAEDQLFACLEADSTAAREEGLELYASWDALDDVALALGGLDRGDLIQGQRDLFAQSC